MGLIKSLLVPSSVSTSSNNFMLVGCYRSDEVDDGHVLVKDCFGQLKSGGVEFVHIDVNNLSPDALGDYIAGVLLVEPSQCHELTTVIYRKTLGNIFFVKQFLLSLFEGCLLWYNIGSAKWCWIDEQQIGDSTGATENVVDLVRRKLLELPDHVSHVLQFLACLGSEFDMTLLQLVIDFLLQNDSNHTLDFAQIFIDHGLIESAGTKFRFIHDRVQEAAYEMLPDSEKDILLFEFGQLLSHRDDVEDRLYTIVDLLDQGLARALPSAESTQLVEVAKLNMQAGKRSMSSAAFGTASAYFLRALRFFPMGLRQSYESN
jgi:predicted ATPase